MRGPVALGGDSLKVKNRTAYFGAYAPEVSAEVGTLPTMGGEKVGKRAAVLKAEGYEEGETLTIVDLLRRLGIDCDTFAVGAHGFVKGMHGMYVQADKDFSDEVREYDLMVLPGGRPGGRNLREDPAVIEMMQRFEGQDKKVGALCSGTIALETAGIIKGCTVTGYTGYAEKLTSGNFVEAPAVVDGPVITSQGPCSGYPFALAAAETFVVDTSALRARTLYAFAGGR